MTVPKFKPEQVVRYGSRTYKVRGYDVFNDHYTLVPTQETIDACKNGWADVQRCIKGEYVTPVEPETKFQVGDKVRYEGTVLDVDGIVTVTPKPGIGQHLNTFKPEHLELVERPKPKKKPGSIWTKEGVELIFLEYSGEDERYWYSEQRRAVRHSKGYASTFTEVSE